MLSYTVSKHGNQVVCFLLKISMALDTPRERYPSVIQPACQMCSHVFRLVPVVLPSKRPNLRYGGYPRKHACLPPCTRVSILGGIKLHTAVSHTQPGRLRSLSRCNNPGGRPRRDLVLVESAPAKKCFERSFEVLVVELDEAFDHLGNNCAASSV